MLLPKQFHRISILLFAFCFVTVAQIGTGTITGQVTDPTGAVVPRVTVTVVNTDTNFTFSTETNDAGLFRVPSLQPGTYRVSYEAKGFKRLVRDNIMLRTGNTLEVSVASLEVGQVTESLDITAALPLLATESSAAGTIVEGVAICPADVPALYQRDLISGARRATCRVPVPVRLWELFILPAVEAPRLACLRTAPPGTIR